MKAMLNPDDWGLETGKSGELIVAGCGTVELAAQFGTPLHVVNEERLERTAEQFRQSVTAAYPGKVAIHYPFKCNSVPGVVQIIQKAGFRAEVMTEFELELALRLGYHEEEIIVNGPCKTDEFLERCVDLGVRLIVVDSLDELHSLRRITGSGMKEACVLLRINPDYTPRGMNHGTATATRRGCAFGLDLKGGEVEQALSLLKDSPGVYFRGFHFHIGTGIRNPSDYVKALQCLPFLIEKAQRAEFAISTLDVGGGYASMTTRELTSYEMLMYEALGVLPSHGNGGQNSIIDDFAREISQQVIKSFPRGHLPELIYEPGRCIASPNQLLLLTVHRVKNREGVGKWLITDGGLGTVTLPTYYEYHEVFLANDVCRPRTEKVSIIGPACFAGDVVYRNKRMPAVRSGEVLAIMDTGAYFNALESSFGFYRPAVIAVRRGEPRLLRTRETFNDCVSRDRVQFQEHLQEEEQ